jgi:hypothetical protein
LALRLTLPLCTRAKASRSHTSFWALRPSGSALYRGVAPVPPPALVPRSSSRCRRREITGGRATRGREITGTSSEDRPRLKTGLDAPGFSSLRLASGPKQLTGTQSSHPFCTPLWTRDPPPTRRSRRLRRVTCAARAAPQSSVDASASPRAARTNRPLDPSQARHPAASRASRGPPDSSATPRSSRRPVPLACRRSPHAAHHRLDVHHAQRHRRRSVDRQRKVPEKSAPPPDHPAQRFALAAEHERRRVMRDHHKPRLRCAQLRRFGVR